MRLVLAAILCCYDHVRVHESLTSLKCHLLLWLNEVLPCLAPVTVQLSGLHRQMNIHALFVHVKLGYSAALELTRAVISCMQGSHKAPDQDPHTSSNTRPVRILQPEGYKQRVKENFQKRSITYDDNNQVHPALCEGLLALAGLKEGQVVLDAACGTGLMCLPAAHAVGPSGNLPTILWLFFCSAIL